MRYLSEQGRLTKLHYEGVTAERPDSGAKHTPIAYCPTCSEKRGADVYHKATSAIYR